MISSNYMKADDMAIAKAWKEAAHMLRIEVVSPFELIWGGEKFQFPVHLPQFGGPKGSLLIALSRSSDKRIEVAGEAGFFTSEIDPETYGIYDQETFRDMLNDLGWYGPFEDVPNWYTGEPWI